MLKYVNIPGYMGLGEVGGIMSHLYQWVEKDVDESKIILVCAYEGEPIVFKGLLFMRSTPKTYVSVDLLKAEQDSIELIVGPVRVITDINEFNKLKRLFSDGEIIEPHKVIKR